MLPSSGIGFDTIRLTNNTGTNLLIANGSLTVEGPVENLNGLNVTGALNVNGTNVMQYLAWLSNQVVALQSSKVNVTNGVFTNLSGTNLTAYSTTFAGTNTGSGTGIFTNVAIVGISNSVNTSTPAILISTAPGIGTNDIIRYATITGNGTTNRFALLGDGGLFQPTNGAAGFIGTNWLGAKTVFPTNIVIGPDDGSSGAVLQPTGSSLIHLYRSGGSVGTTTHFMTWVLNGFAPQFRLGISALNVVATNFVSSPWLALTNTSTTNTAAFITFTNATGTYKINAFNSSGAGSLITP